MFSWKPIYEELAKKLLDYKDRQSELIELLEKMQADGLKIFSLHDEDEAGNGFVLKEMDPFTFFAAFNRGITVENRKGILRRLKGPFWTEIRHTRGFRWHTRCDELQRGIFFLFCRTPKMRTRARLCWRREKLSICLGLRP